MRCSYAKQITFLVLQHAFTMQFGNWAARFCHRRAGMSECFLLLRQGGAKWFAVFVIPAVIAGGLGSICLMLSGIKGIITEWYRPKRRVVALQVQSGLLGGFAPSGHRRRQQ